jgi:hypothetical protein
MSFPGGPAQLLFRGVRVQREWLEPSPPAWPAGVPQVALTPRLRRPWISELDRGERGCLVVLTPDGWPQALLSSTSAHLIHLIIHPMKLAVPWAGARSLRLHVTQALSHPEGAH